MEYNIQLGIAYVFLVGYLARSVFLSVGLPASTAVIITGFTFNHVFHIPPITSQTQTLHLFVICLVPLTAGLNIKLMSLKKHVFVMAWLPTTMELLGIAGYAFHCMRYSLMESLVLGTTLVGLAYGVVMPKMMYFNKMYPGHALCRLMFRWAPLEAAYVVFLFGNLTGFAHPKTQPPHEMLPLVLFANTLRILTTMVLGVVIGSASGRVVSRRTEWKLFGQQVFSGDPVEAFLMTLAMALASGGIGQLVNAADLAKWGLSKGSLFHPELLLIVTGGAFVQFAQKEVLRQVTSTFGTVWVFGQLILFSTLGSRTELNLFLELPKVLPLIFWGLLFRFFGILLGICWVGKTWGCSQVLPSACFLFISTLPRATLQGALGHVAHDQDFFQRTPNRLEAQEFIDVSARLYIVIMSFVGELLLNLFGPALLKAAHVTDIGSDYSDEDLEGEASPARASKPSAEESRGRARPHLFSEDLTANEAMSDNGMFSTWQEVAPNGDVDASRSGSICEPKILPRSAMINVRRGTRGASPGGRAGNLLETILESPRNMSSPRVLDPRKLMARPNMEELRFPAL
jgi:hypothetical protein